tara:strand:- start:52 stop:249 length:198 start_codon:yes stop_codon:yes gene_type:complete
MILNLKEIFKALKINKKLNKNFIFEKFSIDSRNINNKSLFIPLKGKNLMGTIILIALLIKVLGLA